MIRQIKYNRIYKVFDECIQTLVSEHYFIINIIYKDTNYCLLTYDRDKTLNLFHNDIRRIDETLGNGLEEEDIRYMLIHHFCEQHDLDEVDIKVNIV